MICCTAPGRLFFSGHAVQSHWGVRELLVTLKLPYLIVLQTQPPYKGLSLPQGSGQTTEPYRGCETHPCSPPGWVSALQVPQKPGATSCSPYPAPPSSPSAPSACSHPSKQLKASSLLLLLQNITYGEGRGRCRAQTSSQEPKFLLLLLWVLQLFHSC